MACLRKQRTDTWGLTFEDPLRIILGFFQKPVLKCRSSSVGSLNVGSSNNGPRMSGPQISDPQMSVRKCSSAKVGSAKVRSQVSARHQNFLVHWIFSRLWIFLVNQIKSGAPSSVFKMFDLFWKIFYFFKFFYTIQVLKINPYTQFKKVTVMKIWKA